MLRTALLPLACTAVLAAALPLPAIAQTTSTPDNDHDNSREALHNIQNNFAHMTPPPHSVESINKDLQQAKTAPVGRFGGGRGGRGKLHQHQQQDTAGSDAKPQAAQDTPASSANPQPATTTP